MTEDEKEFVKFSQILQEWIPAGPIQSREAALHAAAVDARIRSTDGLKASVRPNSNANRTTGSESKYLPAPHVKQDGSGMSHELRRDINN